MVCELSNLLEMGFLPRGKKMIIRIGATVRGGESQKSLLRPEAPLLGGGQLQIGDPPKITIKKPSTLLVAKQIVEVTRINLLGTLIWLITPLT